jgi:hypothetical protein
MSGPVERVGDVVPPRERQLHAQQKNCEMSGKIHLQKRSDFQLVSRGLYQVAAIAAASGESDHPADAVVSKTAIQHEVKKSHTQ